MSKNFYIKTWGCQMNEYDSSKMEELLIKSCNYCYTDDPNEADLLILNTCSIREKAHEKLFHQLGRWRHLKQKKPNLIIGVGGCVSSQDGNLIFKRAKYVNIVFNPQTLHRLPKMIRHVENTGNPIIDISFPKIEKFDYLPDLSIKKPKAFVSIMEGCNKYCSFCIVPYTRGEEISRPCDDILFEVSHLANQGVREITLLGQNVNAYKGKKHDGSICNFSELIRLVSVIDGIDRIRYITSHPLEFTDDLIEVYKDTPKLVSFLHLPVQSGSDRILDMMKRSYTVSDYKLIINKLKKVRPNIKISSDFIVGFPGETKKDFYQTVKLIDDINFDMSFSFIYSPRPGTPASVMTDSVSEEEKKQRLYILQKKINNQSINHSRRMYGTIQSVLVEGICNIDNMELYGKTETNRIVKFKGYTSLIGRFVQVKITNVNRNSLIGIIIKIENNSLIN